MKLSHDEDELAGAAKILQNLPQALSTDCVERFCQIYEGCEQVAVFPFTFFLEFGVLHRACRQLNGQREHHTDFQEEAFLEVLHKVVEQYSGKDRKDGRGGICTSKSFATGHLLDCILDLRQRRRVVELLVDFDLRKTLLLL